MSERKMESEVNYSRKQMNPILEKFQINPQTNEVFKEILSLFEDKPIYQVWAAKVVFGGIINIEKLQEIKRFVTENKTIIKKLSKKNIISYTTKDDIKNLFIEMEVVEKISILNKLMNEYNTAQKKFLKNKMNELITNLLLANTNSEFNLLFEMMTKISRFHAERYNNFKSTMSATRSYEELKTCMLAAIAESYDWDKKSLITFKKVLGNDVDVVYEKDNIVMMKVNTFKASVSLCGGGRTTWCISRDQEMWERYVSNNTRRSQYFIWNFSLPETHELSHVGFTVEKGNDIIYAHSKGNYNLINSLNIDGKKVSIHEVLKSYEIPKSKFFVFGKTKYTWNLNSFIKFIKQEKFETEVCLTKNNCAVVRVMNDKSFEYITCHTMINPKKFNVSSNDSNKIYVILNFNLNVIDDNSIVVFSYERDIYGSYSLTQSSDAYGAQVDLKYLETIGINEDEYIAQENIDINVLLHKYIDEGNEKKAIELINENHDELNVNYRFNNVAPIFKAAENGMMDLFDVLISHKSFDVNEDSGLSESIGHFLIYQYVYESKNNDKKKSKIYKTMIDKILDFEKFNVNAVNIIYETILDFACNYSETTWVVEKLVANKKVNVNIISDSGNTALGYAIEFQNLAAVKLLGQRPDLIVRKEDERLAKEYGIDLKQYINPKPFADGSWESEAVEIVKPTSTFQELFNKIFNIDSF